MSLVKDAPKYPIKTVHLLSVGEVLERRACFREMFTARLLIVAFLIGTPLAAHFVDWQFAALNAGLSFVCFMALCLVAGSRVDKKRSHPSA